MNRYPDKPKLTMIGSHGLASLTDGHYLAQVKADGWRCIIERTANGLTFTTRTGKPCPVTSELDDDMDKLESCIPVGTILDAEWMARRPSCNLEMMRVFDVHAIGGTPYYTMGAASRWQALERMFPPAFHLLMPTTTTKYQWFYSFWRSRPWAEGIVLKRIGSALIGRSDKCAENPSWIRCKWRGGVQISNEFLESA